MSKKKKRPSPESLNLPLAGIDSHAHLDLDPLGQDLESYLAQAREAGVARVGQVFLSAEAYESARPKFADHPEVFFLAGLHPNDVAKHDHTALDRLRAVLENEPRMKAVGEIGLDLYWDRAPLDLQERFFRAQLDLARDLGLPVVIHCRDALDPCLAILDDEGWAGRALLWHCFGGDVAMARDLLDRGWHISIPGPVTYRKNDALVEAAAYIPLDRLCLETDCPYLAPEPWRGKTNHPALMAFTAQAIAKAKGLSTEEVWRATAETATRFFGL